MRQWPGRLVSLASRALPQGVPSVPGKIFISYRRDDSAGHAGRIHDRLTSEFGDGLLFMDVDSIPLGADFAKVIKDEVAACDILLAVIGPTWTRASDSDEKIRLHDPNDFVRIEISAALERNIPVVPILLDGVPIPAASGLPIDLQPLTFRNGIRVRHESFKEDIKRLVTFQHHHFAAASCGKPQKFVSDNDLVTAKHTEKASAAQYRCWKIATAVIGVGISMYIASNIAKGINDCSELILTGFGMAITLLWAIAWPRLRIIMSK